MAFDLDSISDSGSLRPPRIILLGVEKIGKSTFASQSENPIFIPIKGEEGIDGIKCKRFPTVMTMKDLQEAIYSLYSGNHSFATVVIDSASALEPIVWQHTCQVNGNATSIEKVGGGYAKGYIEALSDWRTLTFALDDLRNQRGMVSIIIGHVKVKRFDDPAGDSYDQYQFDLHDKAANLLYRWADVILFANTKVIVKKEDIGFNKERARGIDLTEGKRFLYTQKRPSHPGGGRGAYGRIPYELPLDWNNFKDAVTTVSN